MKYIIVIIYFVFCLLASQILRGVSISPQITISFNLKIISALFISIPIIAIFIWQIVWRKTADEFEKIVNDRAVAAGCLNGVLFVCFGQILSDLYPSIAPPNIELMPAMSLFIALIVRDRLFKHGIKN